MALSFIVAGCCIALTIATPVGGAADPGAPGTDSSPSTPSDGGILGGPAVAEDASEGRETFGEDMTQRGGRREPGVRPRVWVKTLLELDLSAEQRAAIKPIVEEFQQQMRTFESTYGEELKSLESQARRAKEQNQPAREFNTKIKAIRELMPKPHAHQEKAWALLTPEQQEQMKKQLAEIEREAPAKQRDRGMAGAEAMGAGDAAMTAEVPMADQPRRGRRAERDDDRGLDAASLQRTQFLRRYQRTLSPGAEPPQGGPFTFDEDAQDAVPERPRRSRDRSGRQE